MAFAVHQDDLGWVHGLDEVSRLNEICVSTEADIVYSHLDRQYRAVAGFYFFLSTQNLSGQRRLDTITSEHHTVLITGTPLFEQGSGEPFLQHSRTGHDDRRLVIVERIDVFKSGNIFKVKRIDSSFK